jgi:hypothetical protein
MTCVKCGSSDNHISYRMSDHDCVHGSRGKTDKEHLHYFCRRCQYDWCGTTLEQQMERSYIETTDDRK